MKAVMVTCASCSCSWKLHQDESLYLQLDLSSRPCPHCEAYTLSCRSAAEPAAVSRRRGPARRSALRALAQSVRL